MSYNLRYSSYGERSVLVEWPEIINENILNDILDFKKIIILNYIKQKVDVINAYNSILINYTSTIDNINDEILTLKSLYFISESHKQVESKLWHIPVCYDEEFGIDLTSFSKIKKVKVEEIIRRHSAAIYTVYFIGFLPGFIYLGGLDSNLFLDRKITPNLNIKKGAVGIGGQQTGIYPQDSPGGWHIIGNSPVDLFNPKENPPCFINSGDKVKFKPISKSDYLEIQRITSISEFTIKPENYYG